MNTNHIQMTDSYMRRTKSSKSTFDNDLLDLFYRASAFNLGRLSIAFPEHYAAYQILKIDYKDYKKPEKEGR